MASQNARTAARKPSTLTKKKPLPPGTELTVTLDSGARVLVYVVEDLGDIGAGGERLLRVSSEADPASESAVIFDLPLDLSNFH